MEARVCVHVFVCAYVCTFVFLGCVPFYFCVVYLFLSALWTFFFLRCGGTILVFVRASCTVKVGSFTYADHGGICV